ncbi:MAG: hypothetical protein IPK59_14755 [Rhodospirillaceae bacterium]|nr:hypothetical protein [Rhodospirillaceae bacterium]
MRNILGRWPLAPILAGFNLFLPYAAGNITQLELYEIGIVAATVLGFAALLTLLLYFVVGSWQRAGICATAVIYVLFILPPAIAKPGEAGFVGWFMMLSAIALAIVLIVQSRRSQNDYRLPNIIINSLLIGLLAVPTISVVQAAYYLRGARPAPDALFPDLPAAPGVTPGPDIWHLVLDRYAGAETLRKVYAYDNGPFLAALQARGFAVADDAAANYQRTAHSLASTLNLDFLDVFAGQKAMMRDDLLPLYRSIRNNRAARFLRAQDYRLIHFGPWWEPTRHSDLAETHVNYLDNPDFLRLTLERSILSHIAAATGLIPGDGRADQCRRLHFQFDELERLARTDGAARRKQVFAHLLLPHPPFVVDATGRCKTLAEARAHSRADNYAAQVAYANQRVLALLDAITAAGRPAVVIVQADEGPWPEDFAGDETTLGLDTSNVDWSKATTEQLREKMLILLAVKGVAVGDLPLAADATPVNVYRQVFARYFGSDLPPLPDRSFLFKDRDHPYRFIDVTDRLR